MPTRDDVILAAIDLAHAVQIEERLCTLRPETKSALRSIEALIRDYHGGIPFKSADHFQVPDNG